MLLFHVGVMFLNFPLEFVTDVNKYSHDVYFYTNCKYFVVGADR